MRFSIRQKPLIKSIVYSLLCLSLLLFSNSFFPALHLSPSKPFLLVAAISMLAFLEGIKYASIFAVIFGSVETMMANSNVLIFPIFYVSFALLCVWLFESFFMRNFFTWLLYTLVGLLFCSAVSVIGPMSNWGISLSDIFFESALPTFLISLGLSIPLYPIFKFLKRKTDKL